MRPRSTLCFPPCPDFFKADASTFSDSFRVSSFVCSATFFFPMLFQIHFPLSATGGLYDVPADGPRIGFGALSARRKAAHMTHSPVGLDVFEASDIFADDLA